MNRRLVRLLVLLILVGFVCSLITILPAQGQLVIAKIKGTVKKVDTARSRLEVVQEGNSEDNITYVLVDGFTKVSHNGRLVNWTKIPLGAKIKVEGGMTWDMKMKAKKIWY